MQRTNLSSNKPLTIKTTPAAHRKRHDLGRTNLADVIRQWENSDLPQKEFCRRQALSYSNFVLQRMQLKKARLAKLGNMPRLLPVTPVSNPLESPLSQTGFMVQWPNGARLCVPMRADTATLAVLLAHLGGE